jgi:thioredoxin-related protein
MFFSNKPMIKNILLVLGICSVVLSYFLGQKLIPFLYELPLISWQIAGLTPYLFVLLFAIGLFMTQVKSKIVTVLKFIFIVGIISFQFYLFPIYTNDWKNELDEQVDKTNLVVSDVRDIHPEYSGIVVLASPYCSYCHELGIKAKLTAEKNKLNYIVFLNQTDTNGRALFAQKTKIDTSLIQPVSDLSAMQAITLSWYPVVVQFKNGKPLKRWWYRNMGYPAWDAVANE